MKNGQACSLMKESDSLIFLWQALKEKNKSLIGILAEAVEECRVAANDGAILNSTGKLGLQRLTDMYNTMLLMVDLPPVKLSNTNEEILCYLVAQFYVHVCNHVFQTPLGLGLYTELGYLMASLMMGEWFA